MSDQMRESMVLISREIKNVLFSFEPNTFYI